ncbi:MAG: hypothetical protein E7400_05055 [Ruminococcaceae bacterium]|nr:hypothetical protein [Oscillospiraceae bacterium]
MSLFYKLGGLTIKTDDFFDDYAKHHLSFYETAKTDDVDVSYHIHTNCEHITPPSGMLITEVNSRQWFMMPDGGYAFVDYDRTLSDDIINMVVCAPDLKKVEAWFCPSSVMNLAADRRPYYMIHEVLRYALLPAGGTIIHASSLASDGKGLLFSAPSGTGKSTHTRLWTKYVPGTKIVNDDMPIVRMQGNTPYLYGAPWSGKNTIHENVAVPLSAIIFIERSTNCELIPMDKMDAVWELIKAIRKPVVPALAEKNLDVVSRIVENTPFYRLRCDMSEEAVKTSMQAL